MYKTFVGLASRRVTRTNFKSRRLEVEELESRLVPALSGMMAGTVASAASTALGSAATFDGQNEARVLLSTQPSALAAALAQPIPPAASAAVFAANLPTPTSLPNVLEGALPATLLAQLGYVGLLQRDPRAAFDLSIVYAGGDESEVPVSAQPPRVPVPLPTGILFRDDGTEGIPERDAIPAANPGQQSSPTDAAAVPAADTSGEADPVQQIP